MPYTCVIREPVLYASWKGFSVDDLRDVSRRLETLRARSGQLAVYFARVPGTGGIFSNEETATLHEFLLRILPSCTAIHHVIEGDGFIKSARLATVTTMARGTQRPRAFVVHEDLAQAVAEIKAAYGADFTDVIEGEQHGAKKERASSAFRAAARIVEPKKKG